MPWIWVAPLWPLRYGSSPVVVRLRPQLGSRSMSVCGPNRPVTMSSRASVPSVRPQTLARVRSKEDARFISVVGPVVISAFGPWKVLTPCASVQHGGMMLGVVPVGAAVGPTLLQVGFLPPWNRMLALASSGSVGGLSGSSCEIRLRTAGVYGASAATAGEDPVEGSLTGSAYGTSDGVVGRTRSPGITVRTTLEWPVAVAATRPIAAAWPAVVAAAGAAAMSSPATSPAAAVIGKVRRSRPETLILGARLDRLRKGPHSLLRVRTTSWKIEPMALTNRKNSAGLINDALTPPPRPPGRHPTDHTRRPERSRVPQRRRGSTRDLPSSARQCLCRSA